MRSRYRPIPTIRDQSGFATGIIARGVAWMKDRDAALAMAKKHLEAYKKKWGKSEEKDQKFVIDELQKTVDNLEGKGGIRIDRPLPKKTKK